MKKQVERLTLEEVIASTSKITTFDIGTIKATEIFTKTLKDYFYNESPVLVLTL